MRLNVQKVNSCDAYIGLVLLYNLQDILYPSGIVGQTIQLIMILWGLKIAVPQMANYKRMPLVLKAVTLLLLMYCFYGFWEMAFPRNIVITQGIEPKKVNAYVYVQNALNSFLPFFVFSRFYIDNELTKKRIIIYLFLFFAQTIVIYLHNETLMLQLALERGFEWEEVTNNVGYSFVFYIPFLFFLKRKSVKYAFLIVIMAFLISSMKRGAIATGAIATLWFLYAQIRQEKGSVSKIVTVLLTGAVILVGVWYVEDMLATSDYFVKRINETMEGNSSARDMIYGKIWNEIVTDTSLLHLLFGRGANSSIIVATNYAHNDWLELMINNGLLGVSLGAFFYISLYKTAHRYRRVFGRTYYTSFLMMLLVIFLPTFFSMIIYQLSTRICLFFAFMIGYVKTNVKNNREYSTLSSGTAVYNQLR